MYANFSYYWYINKPICFKFKINLMRFIVTDVYYINSNNSILLYSVNFNLLDILNIRFRSRTYVHKKYIHFKKNILNMTLNYNKSSSYCIYI